MRVRFDDWTPDATDLDNPGATVAENVTPAMTGYLPLNAISSYTSALTGNAQILRTFAARDINSDDAEYIIAGTATKLARLQNDQTWSDISRSGGYSGTFWDFCQIGNRVIATNLQDPIQYASPNTGNFADLTGSPPQARCTANVRDFVVLGGLDSGNGATGIFWSGYNNSESWTPSRATQCDTRQLNPDGGPVLRILGGQTGIIFQRKSIWAMEYVGPPVIFRLRQIDSERGTISARSVCRSGDRVFYLASDGFFELGNPVSIGAEKVNRWFFDTAREDRLDEVIGAVDKENQLVFWAFKSGDTTEFDYLLIYNWNTKQWSYAVTDTYYLDVLPQTGNLASNSDRSRLVASDVFERLCSFTGSALEATLSTKEIGGDRLMAANVRPLVDGSTVTLKQYARNDQSSSSSLIESDTVSDAGSVNFRNFYRYHRYEAVISGGFTYAIGVDVEPIQGGGR